MWELVYFCTSIEIVIQLYCRIMTSSTRPDNQLEVPKSEAISPPLSQPMQPAPLSWQLQAKSPLQGLVLRSLVMLATCKSGASICAPAAVDASTPTILAE